VYNTEGTPGLVVSLMSCEGLSKWVYKIIRGEGVGSQKTSAVKFGKLQVLLFKPVFVSKAAPMHKNACL